MVTNESTKHRGAGSSAPEISENNSQPVWLRPVEATRMFGIGRSRLYELIKANRVRSRVLKSSRDAQRGIRLVSFDSLNELIEKGGK